MTFPVLIGIYLVMILVSGVICNILCKAVALKCSYSELSDDDSIVLRLVSIVWPMFLPVVVIICGFRLLFNKKSSLIDFENTVARKLSGRKDDDSRRY